MAFTFSTFIGNHLDRRYPVVRNLEEPGGVPHLDVYVDSQSAEFGILPFAIYSAHLFEPSPFSS